MDSDAKSMNCLPAATALQKPFHLQAESCWSRSRRMGIPNSSVYVFGQTKIVRVYDELLHGFLSASAISGAAGASSHLPGANDSARSCGRLANRKCAANPSPIKSQKRDRIFRITATETPSLNVRPRECKVAVVVPSSTPRPKGTKEATSWAHRFADSTR